ncbi:hypothetical protein WJX74_006526 [Apatococcus lobatus]|uniref:Glutathione S-transferase n=2 Tax=Apatococcus TaxID=904362 RepID=A0AAW1T190_9CHLO
MAMLDEKHLDYESKQISFSDKGHKSEEILAINPRGQVPTFKDGNSVVNESLAALMYLEKRYPEHSLMPDRIAPKITQRLFEMGTMAGAIIGFMQARGDEKAMESKTEAFRKEMNYWEQYLSASKYIAGDEFSLADIALIPQCLFFERQGASFSDYPKLKAYLAENKERPSIQKNWPPHWKGTSGQDNLKGII